MFGRSRFPSTSETRVNFYDATQRDIQEDIFMLIAVRMWNFTGFSRFSLVPPGKCLAYIWTTPNCCLPCIFQLINYLIIRRYTVWTTNSVLMFFWVKSPCGLAGIIEPDVSEKRFNPKEHNQNCHLRENLKCHILIALNKSQMNKQLLNIWIRRIAWPDVGRLYISDIRIPYWSDL
jgi:hypothetical protein